jgi:hypothetical protein
MVMNQEPFKTLNELAEQNTDNRSSSELGLEESVKVGTRSIAVLI